MVVSMIKVLIVDDSPFFSSVLNTKLAKFNGIEVVGTATNPYEARDKILELDPDLMTLDIEMPRMDGLTFLKKLLPQYPIPVIMVSSLESKRSEAYSAGAISFVHKPSGKSPEEINDFVRRLAFDIMKVGKKEEHELAAPSTASSSGIYSRNGIEIIALGASTGGTDALEAVIKVFPDDVPPIVVTQHMPPVFTKMYAERLNKTCHAAVFEAVDGMRLSKGMCVVAEGGKQLRVMRDLHGYYITSREGEKVSGHCPSVDVLFESVAAAAGKASIAALLTGMGADGAKGLLKIRETGAYTIGQNEESCVVYGMPMEAKNLGAVCEEADLNDIGMIILKKMLMQ